MQLQLSLLAALSHLRALTSQIFGLLSNSCGLGYYQVEDYSDEQPQIVKVFREPLN
jgi:hypothetical protein